MKMAVKERMSLLFEWSIPFQTLKQTRFFHSLELVHSIPMMFTVTQTLPKEM